LSEKGLPLEYFIIDPARPWPGEWVRGTKLIQRQTGDGNDVIDVVVFVGSTEGYKSPWTFFVETQHFGVSRKVNQQFPFERLTPGKSRMIFAHRYAVPLFEHELGQNAPLAFCHLKRDRSAAEVTELFDGVKGGWHPVIPLFPGVQDPCTFGLRDLSYFLETPTLSDSQTGHPRFLVEAPSFEYGGIIPVFPTGTPDKDQWAIGLFLALPLTHIEFCQQEHEQTANRARSAGFDVITLDY